MSTSDLMAAIVGALMPALIAVVVRSSWPSWLKGVAAVGSSTVVGTVAAWIAGDLTTPEGWAQKVLIVIAAAQAAYKLWWQPTGIGPAIERATQPGAPVATKSAR